MSFDLKLKNRDLSIKNGKLELVTDTDKLIQDILKICLTPVGGNPLQAWYGSFLSKTIPGSAESTSILVQVAKSQLDSAFENLKKLQTMQVKSFQKVSADEQIGYITNISILRNQINPSLFNINISVRSKGLTITNTSFNISPI